MVVIISGTLRDEHFLTVPSILLFICGIKTSAHSPKVVFLLIFFGDTAVYRKEKIKQTSIFIRLLVTYITAGNRHKQNSWFCKEIREDNFRFWWRRVHEDASQGMYISKIVIFFFTARILQNQRILCCGECCHD